MFYQVNSNEDEGRFKDSLIIAKPLNHKPNLALCMAIKPCNGFLISFNFTL